MKKSVITYFLTAVLVGISLTTGCTKSTEGQKQYTITNYEAFDTVSQITAYADESDDQTEHLNLLNDLLNEWDSLFDIYEEHDGISNIKTINDAAGKEAVVVDPRIISVLQSGLALEESTDGLCNIALGSVLSIWHNYREAGLSDPDNAALPEQAELSSAAKHTDSSDIIIDETASSVYLADEAMSLDVGAIAKGFAADALAQRAKDLGMDSVLINLGGNVLAVGNKKSTKDGENWTVGIQNPDDTDAYLFKLPLCDMALVTSGDYQRFYEVNGKKYSHIIDPETLYPPEKYKSVTIYTERSGMADALSTALFIADIETGKEILAGQKADCEAVWILQDGSVEMTEGMKDILETS